MIASPPPDPDPVYAAVDLIPDHEAKHLLLNLARTVPGVADKVIAYARKQAAAKDHEAIAEAVYSALDSLDVDDLYTHSGRTRDGYVDICDEAWRMIEEEVEEAVTEMKKLQKHGFHKAAREYCIGIMEGAARYRNAGSGVLEWAVDAPDNCIREVCDEFCTGEKSASVKKKMQERCRGLVRSWE